MRSASRRALSVAMPRTARWMRLPEGVSTESVSPTLRWLAEAKLLVSTVPDVARPSSVASLPRSQSIR